MDFVLRECCKRNKIFGDLIQTLDILTMLILY